MGIEEKLTRLRIGDKFNVIIISANGKHVIGRIDSIKISYPPKNSRSITFELKGVYKRMRWGNKWRSGASFSWKC
jgi:hypothetical protein